MRHAIFMPPFGELADPQAIVDIAIAAEDVRALPDSAQQVRIPLWFGTARHSGKPIERAARHDGIFPLTGDASTVAQIANTIDELRGSREGFDIAVKTRPGTDAAEFARAGATWAMHAFWPGDAADQVLRVITAGRPSGRVATSSSSEVLVMIGG
ncbi:hypothetical protein ACNO8X_20595 [Mycobacterium sp. PDNC021]|uniref:hypothetical protein n=1 Tax=Mycobacterium sp. PDNC021 TaxID=3391399 RepID=UPI003AAAE5A5